MSELLNFWTTKNSNNSNNIKYKKSYAQILFQFNQFSP